MCVSRCLHCVGLSLIPMAIICIVCNSLLLFPNLKANFLLEGHVTAEATWGTGFWGSGFVVCLHVFVCWLQNNNSMTVVFFLVVFFDLHHWIYYSFFVFEGSAVSQNICTEQPDPRLLRLQKKGGLDVKTKNKGNFFFLLLLVLHCREEIDPHCYIRKISLNLSSKIATFCEGSDRRLVPASASGVADVCRSVSRCCVRWFSRACVCWLLPSAAWSASTASVKVLCVSTAQAQGPHGESHWNRT